MTKIELISLLTQIKGNPDIVVNDGIVLNGEESMLGFPVNEVIVKKAKKVVCNDHNPPEVIYYNEHCDLRNYYDQDGDLSYADDIVEDMKVIILE